MRTQLLRAASLAALTSAIGFGVSKYLQAQGRRHDKHQDKLALQEWETDGGGNLPPKADAAAGAASGSFPESSGRPF